MGKLLQMGKLRLREISECLSSTAVKRSPRVGGRPAASYFRALCGGEGSLPQRPAWDRNFALARRMSFLDVASQGLGGATALDPSLFEVDPGLGTQDHEVQPNVGTRGTSFGIRAEFQHWSCARLTWGCRHVS